MTAVLEIDKSFECSTICFQTIQLTNIPQPHAIHNKSNVNAI